MRLVTKFASLGALAVTTALTTAIAAEMRGVTATEMRGVTATEIKIGQTMPYSGRSPPSARSARARSAISR
jgi:branched-chain amino acid transport system substrate-binding protein